MACLIKDIAGKTIVQVKVPVCITIQMEESDAEGMTHDELAGLVDEAIDQIEMATGARVAVLHARRCMAGTPVRFSVARHWDELPVDDCEIMSNDSGFFDEGFEGDDGWQ